MTRLMFGISGLGLAAAVAGIAGCAGDEGKSRDHTSPMYSQQGPAESNLTQTCAYNYGPRAGQTVDYSGQPGAPAVQVGIKCADMQGSSGWAVSQQPGRQQGGRFYTSPGAPNAWGPSGGLQPGFSLICRFNRGPAAGHSADYSSTLGARPSAIGSPCSDGPNSGVVVAPGTSPGAW